MRKPVIAALAALSLVLPGVAHATTAKAAVKIGAKCTKSGATSKVGSTNVICKKNSKSVLVWTKVVESADCKSAKANYATQQKTYSDIVAKIADAKKAAGNLTGADADALRAQIASTEASLPSLKSLVDQLALLTTQICKLG